MSKKFLTGVDLNSTKATNVANPTSAQDAATKSYVDTASAKSHSVTLTVGLANADRILSSANDYATINTAITDAAVVGGTVILRAGAYTPTDHINLQNNVKLEFEQGAVITLAVGKTIKVSGKSDVIIENPQINGAGQAINNFGIYIENSARVWVLGGKADQMTGFGVFITSTSTSTCKDIWVRDMYLYGLGNNDVIGGGPGNTTSSIDNISVTGCSIYQDCTTNSYENGFDIVRVKGVKFIGNHIYGKVQFGTEQYPNVESEFIGNTVHPAIGKTSTSVLITTFGTASSANSQLIVNDNNVVDGQIRCTGIVTQLIQQLVMVGNSVKSVSAANAIHLDYVTNAIVSSNSIYNAAAGIFFDHSTNSYISGNQIDTCVNAVKDNASVASIKIGLNAWSNISSTVYVGGSQSLELPKQSTTNADGLIMGADTYLYRNAAASMKTDGKFIVGGQMGVVTNSPNSSFHVNGSFSTIVTNKTADFTPSISEHAYTVDATAGNVTANLPTSVGLAAREYIFTKTDATANTVTIDGFGTQTVGGSLTLVLTNQYDTAVVKSDNANWVVLYKYSAGNMTTSAVQTVTGAKTFNSGTLLDKGNQVFNVKSYGAVGNDTADDTTAIQSAIAAAAAVGGIVWFPAGTYKITAALKMYTGASPNITAYSNITLAGAGSSGTNGSIIKQYTTSADCIKGINDVANGAQSINVTIQDICLLWGTATKTNSGNGLYLSQQASGGPSYQQWNIKNVVASGFQNTGKYGFNMESIIVSTLDTCMAVSCSNGFYLDGAVGGAYGSVSTSVTLLNCYANMGANAVNGFYILDNTYVSLVGCACDISVNSTGAAYFVDGSNCVTFTGCGTELNGTASLSNLWKISASSQVSLYGCYAYQSKSSNDVYVTGSSVGVTLVGFQDNSSVSGSTGLKVDSGSSATEIDCSWGAVATPRTIAAGGIDHRLGDSGDMAPAGTITMTDAKNIVVGTTTGTKIGTATSQKIGFFNATPVVQQAAGTDLGTVLSTLGLRAAGTAYSIATSGPVAFTGNVTSSSTVQTTGVTLNNTTSTEYQLCNATSAAFAVTLPSTTTPGIRFTIKKTDATANAVTVNGTIDGATNYVLATQYKYVTVISTTASGTWQVVGNN